MKISFNEDNPELALLAGMRPILKKSQWNDSDFENSIIIPAGTPSILNFEWFPSLLKHLTQFPGSGFAGR